LVKWQSSIADQVCTIVDQRRRGARYEQDTGEFGEIRRRYEFVERTLADEQRWGSALVRRAFSALGEIIP
jgi:hypothetical protein